MKFAQKRESESRSSNAVLTFPVASRRDQMVFAFHGASRLTSSAVVSTDLARNVNQRSETRTTA